MQTTAKATKPTASQIWAAKKVAKAAAKIEREAKQQIGAGYGKDRNKIAMMQYNQLCYLDGLKIGSPCDEEEQLNEVIKNLLHYETLIYKTDTNSLVVFEKLLRAFGVISKIYGDKDLGACVKAAQSALDRSRQPEADDYSPNQRRALLRPLLELCNWAEYYGQIVPEKTVDLIARYCSAVQIALYTTTFYQQPKGLVNALFAILSGKESFRDLAKKGGFKEAEFKFDLLDTAWLLYRVAECFSDIKPPQSITDLKSKEWRELADYQGLQRKIRWCMDKWLIPFENATGITLIDYRKFRADCIEIEKKFLN